MAPPVFRGLRRSGTPAPGELPGGGPDLPEGLGPGIAAGFLLAGHFWAWVASIQFTTIANSAVLVSTQPLFVAGLSVVFLGEHPTRRQWVGILVAVSGAVVIGFGAFGLGGRALLGDALALSAGIMSAGYFSIGRSLRKKLDLWAYTGSCTARRRPFSWWPFWLPLMCP